MRTDEKHTLKEVRVDCVLFGFHSDQLKVLLLKGKDTDFWRLPGGSIRQKEPVHEAAMRALNETSGIADIYLQQFQTFGGDPYEYRKEPTRRHANKSGSINTFTYESLISVGYYALVDFEKVIPKFKGTYLWCEIAGMPDLPGPQNDMIELALIALRKDLRYLPLAKLLPKKFTLRDMQKLYETILDRTFDRRNFHKLLMSYNFLIKLKEKRTGTANRSPHLYKIDFDKYEIALQDGISY